MSQWVRTIPALQSKIHRCRNVLGEYHQNRIEEAERNREIVGEIVVVDCNSGSRVRVRDLATEIGRTSEKSKMRKTEEVEKRNR